MQEIIPGIVSSWEALNSDTYKVRSFNVDNLNVNSFAKELMLADALVISAFNIDIQKALKVAHEVFHFSGRKIFYLHGFSTLACWPLLKWDSLKYFTSNDVFVSSCKRDKELFDSLFKNSKSVVIPFLREAEEVAKLVGPKEDDPFVYIGRISEQKNLHNLLVGYSLFVEKNKSLRKLILFGKEDNLGSPNMGLASGEYLELLKGISRDLAIEDKVEFRGFCSREEIYDELYDRDYIFITPTLHSDENFGMAAFKSLIDGKRCLLSDWGGHSDYLDFFESQLSFMEVDASATGPLIRIDEIANKLEEVTRRRSQAPHLPHYYSKDEILAEQIKCLNSSKSQVKLVATEITDAVFNQREKFAGKENYTSTKLFDGYSDPLSHHFFRYYGMDKSIDPKVFKKAKYTSVPWLTKSGTKLIFKDPHKGDSFVEIQKGPATVFIEGQEHKLSYEVTEELLKHNLLYTTGLAEVSGKLFPDKCQTSIDILKEKVLQYFKDQKLERPQFADDFLDFSNERSSSNNIVLFGGYMERILESGTWPFKSVKLWVISSRVKKVLCEMFNLGSDKISVIPRYKLFKDYPEKFDLQLFDSELVYAGRISRVKNISLLIRTVHLLQKKSSRAIALKLIGDFDEVSHDYNGVFTKNSFEVEIKQLIASLDWIKEPIFIKRMSSDLWVSELSSKSIYISLSTYLSEDYAVSVAQAQEAGCPVVLSDFGGHSDVKGAVHFIPLRCLNPLSEEKLMAEVLSDHLLTGLKWSELPEAKDSEKLPTEVSIEELDALRRSFCQKYGSQVLGLTKGMGAHFAESDEGKLLYNKWVNLLGKTGVIETWVILPKEYNFKPLELLENPGSVGFMKATELAYGDKIKILCQAKKVVVLLDKDESKKLVTVLRSIIGSENVLTPLEEK